MRRLLPRAMLKRKLQINHAKERDRHLEEGMAELQELTGQFREFNALWLERRDPRAREKAIARLRAIHARICRLARIRERVPQIVSACRELGIPGYRQFLNGHRVPARSR